MIDDRSTVTTMVGTGFASRKGSGREFQGNGLVEQRCKGIRSVLVVALN